MHAIHATTISFIMLAITAAIIGIFATTDQGVPEIMFWITAVSLAITAGFVFAHIGRADEAI